ncbi:MAG: hypothetical protein IJB45_01955 [Clostridia bacterium]|nr:hypothetical protein [Clostridia bacterium]
MVEKVNIELKINSGKDSLDSAVEHLATCRAPLQQKRKSPEIIMLQGLLLVAEIEFEFRLYRL